MKRRQGGFTLIELLVVIGILAVLLAIVLIAINPARQFSQANNAKRSSDVNAILNAVHQYGADNRGNLTTLAITTTPSTINSTSFAALCNALVPRYIAALPVDPLTNTGTPVSDCTATPWDTNYYISVTTPGVGDSPRVIVTANATELGVPPITVMR